MGKKELKTLGIDRRIEKQDRSWWEKRSQKRTTKTKQNKTGWKLVGEEKSREDSV